MDPRPAKVARALRGPKPRMAHRDHTASPNSSVRIARGCRSRTSSEPYSMLQPSSSCCISQRLGATKAAQLLEANELLRQAERAEHAARVELATQFSRTFRTTSGAAEWDPKGGFEPVYHSPIIGQISGYKPEHLPETAGALARGGGSGRPRARALLPTSRCWSEDRTRRPANTASDGRTARSAGSRIG